MDLIFVMAVLGGSRAWFCFDRPIWSIRLGVLGGSRVGFCFDRLIWSCRLEILACFLVSRGPFGFIVSLGVVLGGFGGFGGFGS